MGPTPYDDVADGEALRRRGRRARGGAGRARAAQPLGGVDRAGAQGGLEAGQRRRDGLDAAPRPGVPSRRRGGRCARPRRRVAAELVQTRQRGRRGSRQPASSAQRRGQRSLKLKCSLTVAAAVEVGAGAQGQLLAGERASRAGQQRGEALGRAVLGAARGARRRGRPASSRASVQSPSASCAPRAVADADREARAGRGRARSGSAAATRCGGEEAREASATRAGSTARAQPVGGGGVVGHRRRRR